MSNDPPQPLKMVGRKYDAGTAGGMADWRSDRLVKASVVHSVLSALSLPFRARAGRSWGIPHLLSGRGSATFMYNTR